MSDSEIVITRGLPQHLRQASAVLFEQAFGDKMRMALPHRETRVAFMARAYSASHVVVAQRDGELLGMAGLSARDGIYRGRLIEVPWDPRPQVELLGRWGSIRAVLGLRLAEHKPAHGELYLDGIAVTPEARGQGVGTRLLNEVALIAREQQMRWVRLDVIDTNPRAQALYERLGYRVTRVQSFGYMERWVGYGGMVSMELSIPDRDGASNPEAMAA